MILYNNTYFIIKMKIEFQTRTECMENRSITRGEKIKVGNIFFLFYTLYIYIIYTAYNTNRN